VTSFPSFSFDSFELDTFARRVTRDGQPIAIADRHFDVLYLLVRHAGELVPKESLVSAGWGDVAVTDNSLEQAISSLRRGLGPRADGSQYIETVPRRGYRFTASAERRIARATDESLDALMAPHRVWMEGRAALESLEAEQIFRARRDFEQVLDAFPHHAMAHVGLANAHAMRFETTRADPNPDRSVLEKAGHHAREACRLEPGSAEAWATHGFVLGCTGERVDALAALRRAVTLEPDNWRHHFRLGYASWGEERLGAARRTLALLPGFPLAHWLAATVHVARNVLAEAERELRAGITGQDAPFDSPGSLRAGTPTKFNSVALHWLLGLVVLARGDEDAAFAEFERELAGESSGHLYARECCANTWYAIGSLRLRQQRADEASRAFEQAIARVPDHGQSLMALVTARVAAGPGFVSVEVPEGGPVETQFLAAAALNAAGDAHRAVQIVDRALAAAPPGNVGWLLPVEPLLNISRNPDVWAPVLTRLRARAA
jgi:DNA-binding winged helix-turn-helix (wHTH) protein